MRFQIFLAIGLGTILCTFFAACERDVETVAPGDAELTAKTAQSLAEQFSHYETVRYDHDALYRKLKDLPEGATSDVVFSPGEGAVPWAMTLHRNGVVEDDFQGTLFDGKALSSTEPLGIRTFEGSLEGGGTVALTISPDMVAATVDAGGVTWILEPIQKFGEDVRGLAIAYREADMAAKPTGGYCEIALAPGSGSPTGIPDDDWDATKVSANCWQVETMVHGDFRYRQQVGGNTNTALFLMIAAVNTSSTRFTSINIHLFVPSGSAVQNTTQDNLSFDAGTLLSQVRAVDNALLSHLRRDLTLFFTGRNLTSGGSSGVAGIAYVATLCSNPTYAYGVAETINGSYNGRIQTHEIGHILGASHDTGCPGGLMYPYYNSSCAGEYPSATSNGQINWQIWFNHGCIVMAPGC